MDNLATNLTNIRDRLGFSQKMVGERLGLSSSLVSKWEKGERIPDDAQMLSLSHIYGVSLSFLVGNQKKAVFQGRSQVSMPAEERRHIGQALNDAAQQIHWVYRAWELNGKSPMRFNLRLEWSDPALSNHVEMVRSMLKLNRRLTIQEVKLALAENQVLVFDWHLPAKLFGLSYRKDYTVVFLNSQLSETQRLFTLAHELAHLIYHLKDEETEVSDLDSRNHPHEKQANRFASELLLPQRELEVSIAHYGKELKRPSVFHRLAKEWNVSAEALYYRLVLTDKNWRWSDAKRFYKKGSIPSKPIISRVDKISEQVAPAMIEAGLEAFFEDRISGQKLTEWWFSDLDSVDELLSKVENISPADENSLELDSGEMD